MISDADIDKYYNAMAKGDEELIIDSFLNNYTKPLVSEYERNINKILRRSEKILSKDEMLKISFEIPGMTTQYEKSLVTVFKEFVEKVFSKVIFKRNDITSPNVKNIIKQNTLELFRDKIRGALSQTSQSVINNIRKYQIDLQIDNMRLNNMSDIDKLRKGGARRLKMEMEKNLIKKNKDYFNMLDNNRIIAYKDGSLHNFQEYSEMATRTTLLNVDRTAVEVKTAVDGRKIAEYYVKDPRAVKTEREICKHIMSTKLKGLSIVAMDSDTARTLGITSLDDAKSQGAFGPNCRHSIRPVSKEYYNTIEKVLYVSELEIA